MPRVATMGTVLMFMMGSLLLAGGTRGSREQAQAMVQQAIELYREKGAERAMAEISREGGPFLRDDLYVFVIGPDGKITAHAFEPSRIGIAAEELFDVDGQPYGQVILDEATPEGAWVRYRKHNPLTKKNEAKASWVVLEDGYIFGCGVYEPGR